MGVLLTPRFMPRVRINSPTGVGGGGGGESAGGGGGGGGGGKTLGVRELRDRDPKRFEWLASYMYMPFK